LDDPNAKNSSVLRPDKSKKSVKLSNTPPSSENSSSDSGENDNVAAQDAQNAQDQSKFKKNSSVIKPQPKNDKKKNQFPRQLRHDKEVSYPCTFYYFLFRFCVCCGFCFLLFLLVLMLQRHRHPVGILLIFWILPLILINWKVRRYKSPRC